MSVQATGQPVIDTAAHYPEWGPTAAAAQQRDWRGVIDLLVRLEMPAMHGALLRVSELIDDAGVAQILALETDEPILAKLTAAAALIELGWAARTGYRANHVSRMQFDTFHDYLRRAEQQLIEVTAHHPHNASAWTFRIMTARGLELGHNEARRRYTQAVKAVPHFSPAQVQFLQNICPKWSGGWDEVHQFARECAFGAPEGSINGAIVVDAHMERWLDLAEGADVGYLRQPNVQQEVTDAAARSVLHPSFEPAVGWVWAHNAFAAYWSLVGNHRAAAMHFRAVGDFVHQFPWTYLGDPATVFARHRATALAKG